MPSTQSSRKRQARLAFTPLSPSSPASRDYNKQIQDRAAIVALEDSPAKCRKLRQAAYDSDSEPPPPTQRRMRQQQLGFSDMRGSGSLDPPVKLPSSTARTRTPAKAGLFSLQLQSHFESSEDDSNTSQGLPSPSELSDKGRMGQLSEKEIEKHVDDGEDDDMPVGTQQRRQRRATRTSSPAAIESEDDDGMPTTAGTHQRRGRKRRNSHSSFIADSPPQAIESDSDDLIILPNNSNKRRRQQRQSPDTVESPETPSKRRSRNQRELSERERRELADDIDALASSSAEDEAQRAPRGTQSVQKNARQKALDKLKRMRSTQLTQVEEVDENQRDNGPETDEKDDDESCEDDEETLQYTSSHQIFHENAEDVAFIDRDEDDDENILGIPSDLPLQFTRYASMKPKELFKYAVEWMVSKVINPAFKSDDPLYQLSFRKLDDELMGLAGSKFTSSAWTQDFTVALQARPDFNAEELDRGSAEHVFRDKCDACNRSNHPPAWEIQFHEKPYYKSTLEEVSHEDEDGHEDDEDDLQTNSSRRSHVDKRDLPDWDEQGREVLPENTIFYVGRFCKENAETAHSLQHWRIHLSHAVDMYLSQQGYNKSEEILRRHEWKTEKRRKYAVKIVDRMDEEGEIKRLYQQYRDAASEARSSKQGRYAAESP